MTGPSADMPGRPALTSSGLRYVAGRGRAIAPPLLRRPWIFVLRCPAQREADLAALKPADFDAWLDWAVGRQLARRVRKTVKGRRKATVDRGMTILKACPNHAHTRHRVAVIRAMQTAYVCRIRTWSSRRPHGRAPLWALRPITGCRNDPRQSPDFRNYRIPQGSQNQLASR